jgi:hypothetical protein
MAGGEPWGGSGSTAWLDGAGVLAQLVARRESLRTVAGTPEAQSPPWQPGAPLRSDGASTRSSSYGFGPVAMGRDASELHSLHDPA